MSRNKVIAIVIVLIVIFAAIFYFFFFEKEKEFEGESFVAEEGQALPNLSLLGRVLGVDSDNGFLTMMLADGEEVKIIVSETTQLIKLEAPFEEDNVPPPGTQFVPEQTEAELSDFKEGAEILVISKEDISGKSEINNVELVQILP